ncbi:unnamed protein product [Dicrocoelium dendriticum]|nr:unnamed protein product [Dicrocoelium dendriticum]
MALLQFRSAKVFASFLYGTCHMFALSTEGFISNCRFSRSSWNRCFCTSSRPLRRCWSCNNAVEEKAFFCTCGKIQPLEIQLSYFDVLGYPNPVVRVNPLDLAGRMRNVQKELHPDKFTGTTQSEQRLASEASTFVNRAYSTLERPLDRFTYILSLHGFEDDVSPTSDPEFLSKVIEVNEAISHIADALTSDDNVRDVSKLQSIISELVDRIVSDLTREEEILVQRLESSQWKEAHQSLVRFRYHCRSLEQIKFQNGSKLKTYKEAYDTAAMEQIKSPAGCK